MIRLKGLQAWYILAVNKFPSLPKLRKKETTTTTNNNKQTSSQPPEILGCHREQRCLPTWPAWQWWPGCPRQLPQLEDPWDSKIASVSPAALQGERLWASAATGWQRKKGSLDLKGCCYDSDCSVDPVLFPFFLFYVLFVLVVTFLKNNTHCYSIIKVRHFQYQK